MPDTHALLTEAEKLARVSEQVGQAFAFELSRVLRDLERELRVLALEATQGNRTALSRVVRAGKLRAQIRQALKAAGYDQLAETATSAGLERLLAQVSRLRGAAELAAFSASDMTRILALKELAKVDVLNQGSEIAHALWRTFTQGLLSQRSVADLLDDLADTLDVETYEARTLYDTTVNVFGRQVEAMKATDGDVYAYLGPADVKLRPFCKERVGKVFTREQIDAMDNGQLPNVFLTGGGYNCRHTFVAVSKLSELRALVNTDERIPEVTRQMETVQMGGRKAA